jgi:hypothetical protein
LTDWNKTYTSDVRGYFPCCPLCGSNKLALHLITVRPRVRSIVVTKSFLKDSKEEEKAKKLKEVLEFPDADLNVLGKFEVLLKSCMAFKTKTGERNIACCVDKNKRVIFMRVFKNLKHYKKFTDVDSSRDALSCYGCGAKWHLHMGVTGLKWAELELESEDAKGAELLGKKLNKNYWLKMAQKLRDNNKTKDKKQKKGETVPLSEAGVTIKCD